MIRDDGYVAYVFTADTIARQSRTIRRLFTAYFLAKGKLRLADRVKFDFGKRMGVREERARIVHALRIWAVSRPPEWCGENMGALVLHTADAIERGEL